MKNIFACMQHHNWSYTEIMEMLPWERDIYFNFLVAHIKEENDKIEQQNRKINN
jgi:hypothetical protein